MKASTLPAGVPSAPPPRPDDVESSEGAEAYARYVAEVWWYTFLTGDSETLEDLAPANARCDACRHDVQAAKKQLCGGTILRPGKDLGLRNPGAEEPTGGDERIWLATWEISVPGAAVLDAETGKKQAPMDGFGRWLRFFVDMQWDGDQWILMNYQMKEL